MYSFHRGVARKRSEQIVTTVFTRTSVRVLGPKIAIALSALALLIAYFSKHQEWVRPYQVVLASGLVIFWMNSKTSWFCIDAPQSAQRFNGYVGASGSVLVAVGLLLRVYRHGW
jgi:hypothetical protein